MGRTEAPALRAKREYSLIKLSFIFILKSDNTIVTTVFRFLENIDRYMQNSGCYRYRIVIIGIRIPTFLLGLMLPCHLCPGQRQMSMVFFFFSWAKESLDWDISTSAQAAVIRFARHGVACAQHTAYFEKAVAHLRSLQPYLVSGLYPPSPFRAEGPEGGLELSLLRHPLP